jgi:hypothetical protein
MISGLIPELNSAGRGALVAAAVLAVVFPALAGGLHTHHGHAVEDCDLCLQLVNLVFASSNGEPAGDAVHISERAPSERSDRPVPSCVAGDPARAPPVPS